MFLISETLQQNNSKVQEVLNKKNSELLIIVMSVVSVFTPYLTLQGEIEAAQKLYWDVRISVLGFKAQIMKLTGEIEQLRDENAGKSSENVNNSEALAEVCGFYLSQSCYFSTIYKYFINLQLERKKQELERLKSTAEVNASVLNEELKSVRVGPYYYY